MTRLVVDATPEEYGAVGRDDRGVYRWGRTSRLAKLRPRLCWHCGLVFLPRTNLDKYGDDACARAARTSRKGHDRGRFTTLMTQPRRAPGDAEVTHP